MNYQVASGATSTAYCIGVINTQLNSWKRAKNSYCDLLKTEHNWGDYKPIILDLGQSLKDLFGANYKGDGRTPFLKQYLDQVFPREYGWNLKEDNLELYKRFENFNEVYNDLCNHFDISKIDRISTSLTFLFLKEAMSTTQDIWLWILQKRAVSNEVMCDQLAEFCQKF